MTSQQTSTNDVQNANQNSQFTQQNNAELEMGYTEFDLPSSQNFVIEDIDKKLDVFREYKDEMFTLLQKYSQAMIKNKRMVEGYKRTLSKLSSGHKNYSFFYKKTLSYEFNNELIKILQAYLQENYTLLEKAIDHRYPNIEFIYPSDYGQQKTPNYHFMKEIFVRKLDGFTKRFNDL